MTEETCPHCGAPKRDWEKRNATPSYPLDYEWWCLKCGKFVRLSNH